MSARGVEAPEVAAQSDAKGEVAPGAVGNLQGRQIETEGDEK